MKNKKLEDFGYINGWESTPDIVKRCNDNRENGEKHDTYTKNIGNCLNEFGCKTCGYFYKIDSSG